MSTYESDNPLAMLYSRFRRVAARRSGRTALREAATGRSWSFAELLGAANSWQPSLLPGDNANEGAIATFPQGHNSSFIFEVLAAWRENRVVCPLESKQQPPQWKRLPKNCVHVKQTSATTGAARLIAFSAPQLMADAAQIVDTMGLRPDWPNLGVISMAHSYGFSNLVLPLLLHGIPLILCDSPLPEAVRNAARGETALTLPAVPAMWDIWFQARSIPPSIRLAISAGAPLSLKLEQAIHSAAGLKIHNFYGSTECGGIAFDASTVPRADDSCIGAPMKGVRLSLGRDGCLVVSSPAVGMNYLAAKDDRIRRGRFHTQDVAELRDGQVFLRGRASDLINVAGRKIAPQSIEMRLSEHPAVAACVVFGTGNQNATRGDLMVAAIVTRSPVHEAELRSFLLERLPAWQIPRDWLFVDSLTNHQLGKTSRAQWRRKHEQERTAGQPS